MRSSRCREFGHERMAAHPVSPKKEPWPELPDPIQFIERGIVGSAGLTRDDVVLEIGAGDGSLTALIAGQAGRVIAVELDDRLIPVLQARFGANSRVTVVRGDIMEMPIERIWSASHTHTQELSTLGDETATHPKVVASALLHHICRHPQASGGGGAAGSVGANGPA